MAIEKRREIEELLRTNQVTKVRTSLYCEMMGICRTTLFNWTKKNKITILKDNNKSRYVLLLTKDIPMLIEKYEQNIKHKEALEKEKSKLKKSLDLLQSQVSSLINSLSDRKESNE